VSPLIITSLFFTAGATAGTNGGEQVRELYNKKGTNNKLAPL
jgi:hypothetical protein